MPEPAEPSSAPWPSYPRIDNSRQLPKQEGRPRPPRAAAVLFGFAYAAVTSLVVLVDYSSETDKLDRGAYTDTFPPLGLAQAATWPLSAFLPQPEYPDLLSDERGVVRISERDRAAVDTRLRSDFTAIAVQAPVLAAAAAAVTAVRRRRDR